MIAATSPLVSEFATQAEAQAYDVWFKARIEQSLADPRPRVAHDTVMSEMHALLASKGQSNVAIYAG